MFKLRDPESEALPSAQEQGFQWTDIATTVV
jgi:hypothetical protein